MNYGAVLSRSLYGAHGNNKLSKKRHACMHALINSPS